MPHVFASPPLSVTRSQAYEESRADDPHWRELARTCLSGTVDDPVARLRSAAVKSELPDRVVAPALYPTVLEQSARVEEARDQVGIRPPPARERTGSSAHGAFNPPKPIGHVDGEPPAPIWPASSRPQHQEAPTPSSAHE